VADRRNAVLKKVGKKLAVLLVVAAVAGAGMFAAAAFALSLVEENRAPHMGVATAAPTSKPQTKARRVAREKPRRGWSVRADRACVRARNEAELLVLMATVENRADVLRLLRKAVVLNEDLLASLRRIPTTKRERPRVAAFLAVYTGSTREDRAMLNVLRGRWDAAKLERWIARRRTLNDRLYDAVLRTGARTCADYFTF
jgi:hypothetical protein